MLGTLNRCRPGRGRRHHLFMGVRCYQHHSRPPLAIVTVVQRQEDLVRTASLIFGACSLPAKRIQLEGYKLLPSARLFP